MADLTMKVLIDNITKNELTKEWGLAIYIEYKDKKILLDTGGSANFAKNAEKMGVDLKEVDYGVLSHAHFDHSDGLDEFFSINQKAPFFLRNEAKENCYEKIWLYRQYIGIRKGTLEKHKDRIKFIEDDYQICDGVTLVKHKTPNLDRIAKKVHMYRRIDKKWVVDDFMHEQSLVFETEKGLVIFNSCSHGGADNIIKEIQKTFPEQKIYAIIGGFHLYNSSKQDVIDFAHRVKDTGIERVVTGHCTGNKAFNLLKQELGDIAEQMYTGLVLEF